MADKEAIKELLGNRYFLFALIGVAFILGQVVKDAVTRYRDKLKDRIPPPK